MAVTHQLGRILQDKLLQRGITVAAVLQSGRRPRSVAQNRTIPRRISMPTNLQGEERAEVNNGVKDNNGGGREMHGKDRRGGC